MQKKRYFAAMAGVLLLAGCGGGGRGLPDTGVPDFNASAGLFDIWTFKAELQNSNCAVDSITTLEEEYRIVQTEDGCTIDDEDAEGVSLANSESLFDDEDTICRAGGEILTLEFNINQSVEGCTLAGVAIARLELGAEGLNGTYGGQLDVEGNCPEGLRDCQVSYTLTGVRGRQLSQAETEAPILTGGFPEDNGSDFPDSTRPALEDAFRKGVNLACWYEGCYREEELSETLETLQETGVEWLAIVPTWYQATLRSSTIVEDPEGSPSEEDIRHVINQAKDLGFKILLKPHVDIRRGGWRGRIVPFNLGAWQASYREFIFYFARLAEELDVEVLSIGTELKSRSGDRVFWLDLIEDLRDIYAGELTYSANWDEYDAIEFWGPLDFIGIDFYFTLSEDPNSTQAEMEASLRRIGGDLQGTADSQRKKIVLTEIGYRSIDGAVFRPYDSDREGVIDLEEQARAYGAVLNAYADTGWLDGIFWWRADPRGLGGPADDGYIFNDKPAQDVLRRAWR